MRRFIFLALISLIIMGAVFLFGGEFAAPVPGGSAAGGGGGAGEPYFLLYRAMELAGARVTRGDLHYWAELAPEREALTAPRLEAQADGLLWRLAPRFVPAAASTRVERGFCPPADGDAPLPDPAAVLPAYILVERAGELYPGGHLRLLLQGLEAKEERAVHLFLTLREEGEARRLGELARRLPAVLELAPRHSNLTFALTGRLPSTLDSDAMEALAREVAGKLGARQIESVREEFMVSVTGYTPLLKGKRGDTLPVNLNLALRRDDSGGTIFWVGTPLIPGMY